MKKYLDPLQIIGFSLSFIVSVIFSWTMGDTPNGILLGLILGLVTQMFDLQVRILGSAEKLENLSTSSTDKVIRSLGGVDANLVIDGKEFGQHLVSTAATTKKFVFDTYLTSAIPRFNSSESYSGFYGSQGEYHRLLYEKIVKQEISFRYVCVIFHKQSLESKIYKLLLNEGSRYYIRHYEAPPTAIPVLNMMSFDDEKFYLGGFHTKGSPGESQVLYIREPHIAELLKDYWKTLWDGGIPLNEGGIIDWAELRRVGIKFGMTESEFDETVVKLKEEVQREKRKLRR